MPVPTSAATTNPCALDDHELAARLSYFLWSSVPDQELRAAAQQGKLRDPVVLEQPVRRMLKDLRVTNGLLAGFLSQWLQLDKLDRATPDAERYAPYFQNNLGELMKAELGLFADAILVEDRSILEFVDADWGFLCYPLAQHCGIDPFPGKPPPSNAQPPWYRVRTVRPPASGRSEGGAGAGRVNRTVSLGPRAGFELARPSCGGEKTVCR